MKKGGFLRNVLDTIRSNQASQSGRGSSSGGAQDRGIEYNGQLKPSHFSVAQVARHGFPEHPTALAFDPVQKIAAIGTKSGAIRIFGRPGVDVWAQHEPAFAVTHIRFIVNQGAIITVTSDESIHLWSLRGPNLKLQLSASNNQGASSASPQVSSASPAPTAASNLSSVSPQSNIGAAIAGGATATSPSSLLGQITDTVSVAVDSANDFLTGGTDQLTPSPTGESGKQITSRQPEILHTLKFQREHITCLHQTLASKWLYIGTERGNVHVANVETFELSGYSIAWNKAIELSRKTHPGAIIHLSECPQDTNKLLIGYESGCIVLWDLKQRNADGRYYHTENLLWLAWHHEGKQFVAAHGDGSLITWQTRSNARPSNILFPHAKSAPSATNDQQQQSLASSLVRSLNNELYRPINKVDWKTLKNNEQFLLFSGGLPYDGFDQTAAQAAGSTSFQDNSALSKPSSRQSMGLSPARNTPLSQQQSSMLKAPLTSPAGAMSLSPKSPSMSPGLQQQQPSDSGTRPSSAIGNQPSRQLNKKILRSTSLTVMLGKSITVLEMDDTIIDFTTICDNSPYENDLSEPYAVIVLLSNELILIDLTSSGYPSFDSPYPSASLNESPVTCVQYLADCSSDLIPFLYSTSQNVVSRAPKKGFSDKEWPINGGEWGQSLQSYPELVITGHADGTIKFWDMSGINFDLISKIKTSKLFDRPSLPPSTTFISSTSRNGAQQNKRGSQNPPRPSSPLRANITPEHDQQQSECNADPTDQTAFIENLFAIERIEFCSNSRHLLVAGACSQVIQFRLNKKDSHSSSGSANSGDLTTILVEPLVTCKKANIDPQKVQQHLIFKTKDRQTTTTSSSSGGSSSSSGSHRARNGFQAELICLIPLIMHNTPPECEYKILCTTKTDQPGNTGVPSPSSPTFYCLVPPKITALAMQENHNILAYAHDAGIVLVDLIQKCVIMTAALSDLYGGASAMTNSRDISIQPFATSSILQHHYQATSPTSAGGTLTGSDFSHSSNTKMVNNTKSLTKGGKGVADQNDSLPDNENLASNDSCVEVGGVAAAGASAASNGQPFDPNNPSRQPPILSRYTTNSMFQRQLSTNALNSGQPSGGSPAHSPASARGGSGARLFQRQMTASQLFSGSSTSGAESSGKQRAAALLAGVRGAPSGDHQAAAAPLGSSATSQGQSAGRPTSASAANNDGAAKKQPNKNKRIISRMLSISAIHTTVGSSSSAAQAAASATSDFNASKTDEQPASEPASEHHQHHHHHPQSTTSTDKFDSPFSRSRSSSSSSTTAQHEPPGAPAAETIQCLAFVDPLGASAASGGAAQHPPGCGAAAGPAGQLQSSAGANHKSLGSNEAGQLALWLGTSAGSVLLVSLTMPDSEDNRVLQLQSIQADAIPQANTKLPGQILCLATFTCEAPAGLGAADGSQSSSLEGDAHALQSPSSGALQSAASGGHAAASAVAAHSPTSAGPAALSGGHPSLDQPGLRAALFLIIVSEKRAQVYQVPSQAAPAQPKSGQQHHHHLKSSSSSSNSTELAAAPSGPAAGETPLARLLVGRANLVASRELSDTSFACRSAVVQMRSPDESCLVSYLATGNIVVHALPRLRPVLLDADFVPLSSARIAQSMRLSRNGHGLYQPSAGEICKFTIGAQYRALVNEMTGALYVARDMPEMPRANFFKSLFSVSQSAKQSDRDELFGEFGAGRATRGVAKHIESGAAGASSGLEKLKSAAVGTMGHDMRVAREGLDERGEKLSEIEDRTLNMLNQSESYAQAAHQLAQKFKDKKWYQF